MPIVQRHINYPLSYADPKFYSQSQPSEMLADMHFSSMVGVLNQLGFLSSHAASIFKVLSKFRQIHTYMLAMSDFFLFPLFFSSSSTS
jgi:hypothetical protein